MAKSLGQRLIKKFIMDQVNEGLIRLKLSWYYLFPVATHGHDPSIEHELNNNEYK